MRVTLVPSGVVTCHWINELTRLPSLRMAAFTASSSEHTPRSRVREGQNLQQAGVAPVLGRVLSGAEVVAAKLRRAEQGSVRTSRDGRRDGRAVDLARRDEFVAFRHGDGVLIADDDAYRTWEHYRSASTFSPPEA